MSKQNPSKLIISQADYQQLLDLIEKNPSPATDALDEEISRAKIVANNELPTDVVVMNSQVTFIDADSAEENTIQLVYPQHADVNQQKISILSPVGSALIGLSVGGTIDWPVPQGIVRRLKVVAVKQK